MLSLLRVSLLSSSLLIPPVAGNPSLKVDASRDSLVIRVAEGDWGSSRIEDMRKVLYSAASELLRFFPDKRLSPILVGYSEGTPITLYQRGPNGEYLVTLSARNRHWAQLAYQFSHELCHVMARNDRVTDEPNQWFEESLCETASLFVLKRMALTWRTSPPYPNWRGYAPALQDYVDDWMNEPAHRLPRNTTFAAWYRVNADQLSANPVMREKNAIVARQLLSMLEQNPANWEAIRYLNMSKPDPSQTFRTYLGQWSQHATPGRRRFIRAISDLFDV